MRAVFTLAAFGVLLIMLQTWWAPGDDVGPWPIHIGPLLMGIALMVPPSRGCLATRLLA